MNSERKLPLCRGCEFYEGWVADAMDEIRSLEAKLRRAEQYLSVYQDKLDHHQHDENHPTEDDPWMLHQLAEKKGQTDLLEGQSDE